MSMERYNEARLKVQDKYESMMATPTESTIADFFMACAINGLVVMPSDDSDYIPTPICGFIDVPQKAGARPVPCYIFPADQALP